MSVDDIKEVIDYVFWACFWLMIAYWVFIKD